MAVATADMLWFYHRAAQCMHLYEFLGLVLTGGRWCRDQEGGAAPPPAAERKPAGDDWQPHRGDPPARRTRGSLLARVEEEEDREVRQWFC